jgi:iron(III) transport system substrate-binding protein
VVATSTCGAADEVRKADAAPIVYVSIDEPFAREVLAEFQKRTGIAPVAIFDSEAGKTTGLVNRIIAEDRAGSPKAHVFWSSEIFNTIRLARLRLLEPYAPSTAADIPGRYRDPENLWTALAVRGRVIAYDASRVESDEVPRDWKSIAKPEMASRTAIANPLFGTTKGHVAAMFALWGKDEARGFLQTLRDNGVVMTDGNSAAVRAIIAGRAVFAATDTDDVWVAQRAGHVSLDLVYPDMGDGGTLLVPCSVAVLRGGVTGQSKALVDYLVSADVERMLAKSDSRNIPVRPWLREEMKMQMPAESRISFDAVVDAMDEAEAGVREILIR